MARSRPDAADVAAAADALIVLDGTTLWHHLKTKNMFLQSRQLGVVKIEQYGVGPLATLFFQKGAGALLPYLSDAKLSRESLGGKDCSVISWNVGTEETRLWIEGGRLRRFRTTRSISDRTFEQTIRYEEISRPSAVSPDTFVFSPPKGARPVSSTGEEALLPVGAVAPEVSAARLDLDGGELAVVGADPQCAGVDVGPTAVGVDAGQRERSPADLSQRAGAGQDHAASLGDAGVPPHLAVQPGGGVGQQVHGHAVASRRLERRIAGVRRGGVVDEDEHRLGLQHEQPRGPIGVGVVVLVDGMVRHDGDVAGFPLVAHAVVDLEPSAVEDVEDRFVDVEVHLRPASRRVLLQVQVQGLAQPVFRMEVVAGECLGPVDELDVLRAPHARAGPRPVGKGGFLLLDFGARVRGYCADVTRTVVVGARANDAQRALYDLVAAAQRHARSAIRAGMSGREADALARALIAARGFGDAFGHSSGHGLGLEVHEAPRVSQSNGEPLPVDAVVTIEPGVYVDGAGGVRLEDDVHLAAEGPVLLSDGAGELAELT